MKNVLTKYKKQNIMQKYITDCSRKKKRYFNFEKDRTQKMKNINNLNYYKLEHKF